MAADRRSSMSSIRSAMSRGSMSSDRGAQAPQLGPHRPASPLTAGSSVSGHSPPVPPPKDRLSLPMTPQRKPVQRQKSPLSSEAFSSPASIMPGAFPQTPPVQGLQDQQPYPSDTPQSTPGSAPGSKSSKRLSSMRSFLPFKSLRKSYDNTSPDSSGFRPTTPGADSLASSARPTSSNRPSLRKKMSGTFWKRKSSLGTSFVAGEAGQGGGEYPRGPETFDTNERNEDTIMEDSRPATPAFGDDSSPPIKKRKSSTFWRRKSSLTLAETMNAEKQGWGRKSTENGKINGNGNGHSNAGPTQIVRKLSERQASVPESEPQSPPPPRSYSPPPQLPEFVGAGGGLGLGDDFFKSIDT